MAAPAVPTSSWPGKGFWQNAIDVVTAVSNMSIPIGTDAAQTGVLSGTTASLIVAALIVQRDLT